MLVISNSFKMCVWVPVSISLSVCLSLCVDTHEYKCVCLSVCLCACMKRSEVVKYLYQFFDAGPPTELGLTVQARLPLLPPVPDLFLLGVRCRGISRLWSSCLYSRHFTRLSHVPALCLGILCHSVIKRTRFIFSFCFS